MNTEKIVEALKNAGIMEVEIYGMAKEIDYLSSNLNKNETIKKAALGVLKKEYGVFIVTTNRAIFLHRFLNKVQLTECDLKKVISISHKKQFPETLTIHMPHSTIVLEGTRPPFGSDTFKFINEYLKFGMSLN